jgi:predicted nucleic acid-binding protein
VAVVSNSSPLIALVRIQRLDLLPAIFESVLVPPAVAREISPSIPVLAPWLRIQAPSVLPPAPLLRRRLGAGEREALALAIELKADWIILDDLPARRSSPTFPVKELRRWKPPLAFTRRLLPPF